MRRFLRASLVVLIAGTTGGRDAALAQVGTAFTYQGRLTDGAAPANGSYDLELKLWNALSGGGQVGSTVTLPSVSVTSGLFTVAVDFGPAAFAGSRRWLEIGVRLGGSSGAFTTLVPRQELTPVANAIFASNAATVSGLTCTNGQVAKWSGTAWSCGTDVDTNSGGTVTSVGTGAGLTGGPVTAAGSLSIATGGVISSMIANGAVGAAQINQAQVQARVSGACAAGHYLQGINPNGTVACLPLPSSPPSFRSVDAYSFGVTHDVAVAIGPDGLPVFAYPGVPAGILKVAKCGNLSCSLGNTLTTVDAPANSVGDYISMAMGSDGLPVISYQDITAGALKVAKCGNPACSAGNTITTVQDAADVVGAYTAIAAGSDGFPVIAYQDDTAQSLIVAKCGNLSCTAGNTFVTVDPGPFVGSYNSIAIGTDGLPVVSYRDGNFGGLRVAKCGNLGCTAGNTLTLVDTFGNAGGYTSIAIGADGLPIVSHYAFGAGVLRVAKCGNPACSAGNGVVTVDIGVDPLLNPVGNFTSLAVGPGGLPVISYTDIDATRELLKVALCGNAACSAGNALTIVDQTGIFRDTSIAIGSDGLPIIGYGGATSLNITKCGHPACR